MKTVPRIRDLAGGSIATATGIVLVFVLMSSSPMPAKLLWLGAGLGLGLCGYATWRHLRLVERFVAAGKLTLGGEMAGVLTLHPKERIKNPRIYLSTKGKPATVTELWMHKKNILEKPAPITDWQNGRDCKGKIGPEDPLHVFVTNDGQSPATCYLSVTAWKD